MAWRVQKECLKKPALRLEDGDSDHRLKPTRTHSGCQSHRDRSFPYHPGLVAPGLLAARVPPPAAHDSSRSRGHPQAGAARPPAPLRAPQAPFPAESLPALPAPAAGFPQPCPGLQRGTARSLRPHLGQSRESGFLPSFLPSPSLRRAGGSGASPRLPRGRGRAAAPARYLLPRRSGTAPGTPAPCPSRGAPHSPRRARRAASETWG